MGRFWLAIQTEGPQIMKFFVAIWLTLVALDSLTEAGPVPENRGKAPPKEVQIINKWLGVPKTSDILKDILEVAKNIKGIKGNKNKIKGNADDVDALSAELGDALGDIQGSIAGIKKIKMPPQRTSKMLKLMPMIS